MEKNNLGDWMEAILSKVGLGRTYRKNKRIHNLEKKFGEVDFSGHILQNELGFNAEEGNDYTPSPDYLLNLCKNRITSSDSIIDLGCGKGYAMYLMSQFPFKSIYGIDISDNLVKIASDNMKIIDKLNRCQLWTIDATKLRENSVVWDKLRSCNYVYIYNSFPKSVMAKVVEELEELCIKDKWNATIWYVSPSPECLELMKISDRFKLSKRYFENEPAGGVYEFQSIV